MALALWSLVSNRQAVLLSFAVTIILICFQLGPLTEFIHFGASLSPVFCHEQNVISPTSANQTLPLAVKSAFVEHVSSSNLFRTDQNRSKTLDIASQIFVLSLPRRADRRVQMEILRASLDIRWTYVDAVQSTSAVVENIMARIKMLRRGSTLIASGRTDTNAFRWPQNIDALSSSSQPLGLEGSDLWTLHPPTHNTKIQVETASIGGESSTIPTAAMEPLTCANEDNTIFPFTLDLPEHKLLTRPKIACWNSHLSIIRRIAEHDGKTRAAEEQDVSVIFEDDVDMEWDIRGRLARIWTLLPVGWDVVFLGA